MPFNKIQNYKINFNSLLYLILKKNILILYLMLHWAYRLILKMDNYWMGFL